MNLLFVVVVPFPFGEASSIRAFNLCKLLSLSGHKVHVISDYPSKTEVNEEISFCTYENAETKYKNGSIVSKSMRAIEKYIDENHINAVLMNARYDRYDKIVSLCKKRNIKIFVESCEWYDASSFKLRKLDLRFWLNEKMIRYGFKKADGFISISELLNNHNYRLSKNSIYIPTILDVQKINWKESNNNSKIKIVYAGSLGRSKELLGPIIRVLAKNIDIQKKITFHIYGASFKQVCKNIRDKKLLNFVGDSVVIHGKVSQTTILEIVRNADFIFFLRPYRRSSNAGFPTKLGESMAVGTPVITNNTGDIEKYVYSGKNGYIISSLLESDVHDVLKKVIQLSHKQMDIMRKNARGTAEKYFDYKNYVSEIKSLFNNVER